MFKFFSFLNRYLLIEVKIFIPCWHHISLLNSGFSLHVVYIHTSLFIKEKTVFKKSLGDHSCNKKRFTLALPGYWRQIIILVFNKRDSGGFDRKKKISGT